MTPEEIRRRALELAIEHGKVATGLTAKGIVDAAELFAAFLRDDTDTNTAT
jgi:hypothetical protein